MPQGFSLIEVLISLLLLSFIVLGFEATSLYAVQQAQQHYFFKVAESQLYSLAQNIRAQKNITAYFQNWNQENKNILPYGKGLISGKSPDYQIQICWGEKKQCLAMIVSI